MARFSVGDGFTADFDAVPLATASGAVVAADDHLIRIATEAGHGRPAGYESFIGDFTYTSEGLPVGTIDTYRFDTEAGAPVYRIAHAALSVEGLRAAAGSGDPQAFLELIFRGRDRLTGGAGDDVMRGYGGNDRLDGRKGDDTLSGMAGRDRLSGNGGDDVLLGGGGADRLAGGTGDDWLDGGVGRNVLTDGAGADTFVFRAAGRPDIVTDFGVGDSIALGLPGLGAPGALDPVLFHRGSTATTAAQKILYDPGSGWLRYAEHGVDTVHPVRVAFLGRHLDSLDAGDFLIV